MTEVAAGFEPPAGCWGTIGVSGDRSCPELARVVHCRNCPVLMRAAGELFDQPASPDYVAFWSENVARAPEPAEPTTSVVLFRIGGEWLALDTPLVQEVAAMRPVHRVAHRWHTRLEGLVNIRGQLQLCVALGGLLGIPLQGADRGSRLVVMRDERETWVFRASEVSGVHRFPEASLEASPASLPSPLAAVARGVFPWAGTRVAYLRGGAVASALRGAIA